MNYNVNTLISALKNESSYKYTENLGIAKSTTCDKLYDMFALGGAYRARSEADCILLFKEAYKENPAYALKCLFYLRDCVEGQGERRFFRVCLHWLASNYPEVVKRNLRMLASDMCRWDDIYCLVDTPVEKAAFELLKNQLLADLQSKGSVSLAAKWAKSENCSSAESKRLAKKTMEALGVSAKAYRKILSTLRERIRVLERLMSANKWHEIEFDKVPSRAGLLYRDAFARHEVERYEKFAKDVNTKVNAKVLYPYDVVHEAIKVMGGRGDIWWRGARTAVDDPQRLMVNKYWENLKDRLDGASLNALVVCDTSASMLGGGCGNVAPIDVAVSLAMYAAERNNGPFANHYISFSRQARLVEVRGVDFCDKVSRIVSSNICENTNLESVYELLIKTIKAYNLSPEAVPDTLVVVSDQEIDAARGYGWYRSGTSDMGTTMSQIRRNWERALGTRFKFPNMVYWNVNARNNTFLSDPASDVTFISGSSPILFEQLIKGKTSIDVMMDKLNSSRYANIH